MMDTDERQFICIVQLVREASSTAEINGSFTADDGGSFLSPPSSATGLVVRTEHGSFTMMANENGELFMGTMALSATGIVEALIVFHDAVIPFLDHLSYVANVPVRTVVLTVYDAKNEIHHLSFVNPFPQTVINDSFAELRPELKPVYALYREARTRRARTIRHSVTLK